MNDIEVVNKILSNLNSRKGFDWWWDELDEEIQDEIRDEISDTIQELD